jgi:hypothetical protein
MPDFQNVIASPVAAYAEGIRFFSGQGMVNNALRRITEDLTRHGIDYTVIGAVALNQHGYRRFTEDIDLLLTKEGLAEFREKLVGLGYRPAFEGARKKYRTTAENIPVEIVVTGEYPGDGLPKAVQFPDPKDVSVEIDGVKTITLEKLIELKLASGISAPHRLKDLADVLELIRIKELSADFAMRLDESVRQEYLELQKAAEGAEEIENYL